MVFHLFHVQKWNALTAWIHKFAPNFNTVGEGFDEVTVCLYRTLI